MTDQPDTLLFRFPHSCRSPWTQMAIDQALLECLTDFPAQSPRFRYYSWDRPCLSIGYSQPARLLDPVLDNSPPTEKPAWVRRATGGGLVDHRHDLTYALVLPAAHSLSRDHPLQIYGRLHAALQVALSNMGRDTFLFAPAEPSCGAPTTSPRLLDQARFCFRDYSCNDLIDTSTQRKIGGAAMKRSRHGLLVQGSIDLTVAPECTEHAFQAAFIESLATGLGGSQAPSTKDLPTPETYAELEQRFRSREWNYRR